VEVKITVEPQRVRIDDDSDTHTVEGAFERDS